MKAERISTAGMANSHVNKAPPPTSPSRKAQRHRDACRLLVSTPLVMPLTPLTRPTPASSIQLATPIRTPPDKASE